MSTRASFLASTPRRHLRNPCVLIALVLAGCGGRPLATTSLVVEVWSDLEVPGQIDTVRIELRGDETRTVPFALGQQAGGGRYVLPLRFALIPLAGTDQSFEIFAFGESNGRDVVNQSARVSFLPHESRVLTLVLGRDCVGKECTEASTTCSRGRCESNVRPVEELPVFNPEHPPAPPDGGLSGPDAGPADAGADAADARTDAGDAAEAGADAGCDPRAGQGCGSCGGTYRCDGTCSVVTPGNLGQPCGPCGGTYQCDGSCNDTAPRQLGVPCGPCGATVQCDGSCPSLHPADYGQPCGFCGGTVQCDGTCPVPSVGCCTFPAAADTMVFSRPDTVDQSFAAAAQLSAQAWTWSSVPGVQRSYVRFDLSSIPVSVVAQRAVLRLFADTTVPTYAHAGLNGASHDFVLHRVAAPWDPSTLTWNMEPNVSLMAAPDVITLDAPTAPYQDYAVTVTDMVRAMIAAPAENYGFALRLVTEQYYRRVLFGSSDHPQAALRPRLEVELTAGSCPP